jgi:hypothetical protein
MPKLLIEKFITGEEINVSKLSFADRMSLMYDLCALQSGHERKNVAKSAGESKKSFQERISEMQKRLQAGK